MYDSLSASYPASIPGKIMDASTIMPTANQLLASLPAAALRRLLPHLEATTLSVDQTLFPPAGPLQFAYFPTSSIVTLSYAIEEGAMAKAWPVGREGMVGISLFLGSPHRDNQASVQFGGLAFRISASALRSEFQRAGALQQLLLRYVFALMTQASQLSVCNLYHSVDQRLCRFLSRAFDRVNGHEVFITQARIATLLGVRREGVTEIASRLREAGIIKYWRGHITLVNQKKLESRSCACGGIIRRAFAAVSEKGD
jgi:CRP-like cAMP-binding protein